MRPKKTQAFIDPRTSIGSGSVIEPSAEIFGGVEIGEEATIQSNVIIYGPATIGKDVFVGSNSVIGFPGKRHLAGRGVRPVSIMTSASKGSTIIGDEVTIRPGCSIYSSVSIGSRVTFGHGVVVRENVSIGPHSLIGTSSVIDGDCKVGRRVSIQTGVYVCARSIIEDQVFLGPCCVLTNDKFAMQRRTKLIGPTIRRGASIGANALIMPGVVIGRGAVVGAHAFVNKHVPPRTVFAGVPARKLKDVPSNWQSILASRSQ